MSNLKLFWQREKILFALACLTPPLLALLLYGRVLGFPFFLDDDLNFTWMRGRTLLSYWFDSSGYKYYRPISFGMWRLTQIIFGETNSVAFQAINFLTLILVGWLTSYLAAYLCREGQKLNGVAATLAGALVITFPFLPQSISNVAQGFYFYIAFAFLACFVSFARYRQTQKMFWAVLTIVIGILAPAIHENLIVIGGMLFVWLVIDQETSFQTPPSTTPATRAPLRTLLKMTSYRVVLIPLIVTLGNVLWFLLWLQIPKVKGDGLGWVGWTSLSQSIAFFLQGLTYPVQPLAPFFLQLGWSETSSALIVGIPCLILLSAWLIKSGQRRLLAISLAWYALNSAPMIFGLGFHYMVSNMRFLVSPVPAVALLWAGALIGLWRLPRKALRYSTFAASAFLVVVPSMTIINQSIDLHHRSLKAVHDLKHLVQAQPNTTHLIINPIDWIARNEPHYALGHETVQILPGYLNLRGLAYTNTGVWAKVDGIIFNNIKPELKKHWYNLAAVEEVDWETMAQRLPAYDRVWLTRYSDERVDIVEAGKVEKEVALTSVAPLASFDSKILLLAAKTEIIKTEMKITLTWYVPQATPAEAFRHVRDCEGNELGLGDGPALGGVYPVWLWHTHDRITDVRFIPLQRTSSCYRLELGLYNPQSGQRLVAYNQQGTRLADDVFILEIK